MPCSCAQIWLVKWRAFPIDPPISISTLNPIADFFDLCMQLAVDSYSKS